MTKGPRGEKRPADLNRRAFDIVRVASGEATDPAEASQKRTAGKAGGNARAAALSSNERKAIASKAAKARWGK